MTMPRLLKRLSQKSLRNRTKSFDSATASDGRRSPPPPLPLPLPPPLPPKGTSTEGSYRSAAASSRRSLPSRSPDESEPLAELNGNLVPFPRSLPPPNGYPAPPNGHTAPPNGHAAPPNGLTVEEKIEEKVEDKLSEAWDLVSKKVENKIGKLQKIENQILGAQAAQKNNATVITGVITALEVVGGIDAIEEGVNSFMKGSAVLMKSLDEVAKLHPFIGVAVLTFKAAWTLEMKRRENDKRIIALYVEMKDMMGVLVQLKGVKSPEDVAPDGTSIKGRVEELSQVTAKDIKACANACDTYSKKKTIVKVINGPLWEGKLVDFVGLFTKRRSEFEFALAIHTARGVDQANKTLGSVEKTTEEMNAKMDMMMKMFERFVLPEQKEMAQLIEQKGGREAVQGNDKILRELSEFEQKNSAKPDPSASASAGPGARRGRGPKPKDEFDDIKADLRTDPDEAIQNNADAFSRKFDIQTRQITAEVSKVIKREGDRIITALTSGPHDKILDPDVHKMWQEMNWRGSVKARHFVMVLRDFFQEKWANEHAHATHAGGEPVTPLPDLHHRNADDWSLNYINVVRLQPISEAFDDDASGFVTVKEVNALTSSRPLDWSLPHWISYWAVGWHQTLTIYASKIRDLIGKMFAILPYIRPENQNSVHDYLEAVYRPATSLHESINPCFINDVIQARFQSFVDTEEERLKVHLEAVRYDIDEFHTLAVITGPGKIEKFAMPLVYLILKHHFELFRLSKSRIMHPDELWDAADTILWVFHAMADRLKDLESIFRQQQLDAGQQFKTFAHGIFQYFHDPTGLWAPALVRESDPPTYPYNDELEAQDVKVEDICNYPLDQNVHDYAAYEITPSEVPKEVSASPFKAIFGPWNGYIYSGEHSTSGMISFTLSPDSKDDSRFQASGRSNASDFNIFGSCSLGKKRGVIAVSFRRIFPVRFNPEHWEGKFNPATGTITGSVLVDEDDEMRSTITYTFLLKRISPELLRFRPSPKTIERNKARALWTFAISATRAHVRQRWWSWSYFRERRDIRNRFIRLHLRSEGYSKPLNETEEAELHQIRQALTNADSRFYHSLALYRIRVTTQHGVTCSSCKGHIGGSRVICLTCQTKDTWDTVDLCDVPECMAAGVERDDLPRPHLATHDLVKVRRVVHLRNVGQLEREAKRALDTARDALGISQKKGNAAPSIVDIPKCMVCHHRVTQPCWYCIECDDDSFICNECDAKGIVLFAKHETAHDFATHDLVRCQELVEDDVEITVEDRLANIENLFGHHEKVLEDRLANLEIKLDHRLFRVEKMLGAMLGRLGVEAT